ncbi:MAG: lysophospholipid acyltransferase family protein [Chloroflexota bacterium]|nr:lysophospholipid acyltransferase family protein [Chloroflexota bacterium]
MSWFYYAGIIFVVRPLLFLLTRYRVLGEGNVPKQGPLIIAANHVTLVDPPLLSTSIRRRIVFMGKDDLFSHFVMGPMVKGWRAFPVRRGQLDREALRRSDQALREGLALGIFPEAMRSTTGNLQQGYTGAALIAMRFGCPILPVGIAGADRFKRMDFIFRRPRVIVNIGEPFTLPVSGGRLTKEQLAPATDMIMARIAGLLPEDQRGHYGD